MKVLGAYKNGNYTVALFDDGTKIRKTQENSFKATFPECIDIKITNYCDKNCPFCHEGSDVSGRHGDLINLKFIDTLRPFTELAIGGGNPLSHPDLYEFLKRLKKRKIIANITINQKHFEENQLFIDFLIQENLINGLGISLINPTEDFINKIEKYPNIVLHVINGVITKTDLEKLYDKNLKILILGYKMFRRGKEYYSENVEINKKFLYKELKLVKKRFKTISFDNLALKQLDVKRIMSFEEWNEFYMGDDGQYTMYIDVVNNQFAKNSTTSLNERYKLLDDIVKMFERVKEK